MQVRGAHQQRAYGLQRGIHVIEGFVLQYRRDVVEDRVVAATAPLWAQGAAQRGAHVVAHRYSGGRMLGGC